MSVAPVGARGLPPGFEIKTQSKQKVIEIIQHERVIELAPHQLHALVRLAGEACPDSAVVGMNGTGYVTLTWTETEERET